VKREKNREGVKREAWSVKKTVKAWSVKAWSVKKTVKAWRREAWSREKWRAKVEP